MKSYFSKLYFGLFGKMFSKQLCYVYIKTDPTNPKRMGDYACGCHIGFYEDADLSDMLFINGRIAKRFKLSPGKYAVMTGEHSSSDVLSVNVESPVPTRLKCSVRNHINFEACTSTRFIINDKGSQCWYNVCPELAEQLAKQKVVHIIRVAALQE